MIKISHDIEGEQDVVDSSFVDIMDHFTTLSNLTSSSQQILGYVQLNRKLLDLFNAGVEKGFDAFAKMEEKKEQKL